MVPQQIRSSPERAGHWKTTQGEPILVQERAYVDTHVRSSGLFSRGRSELMTVRGKVAELEYMRTFEQRSNDALLFCDHLERKIRTPLKGSSQRTSSRSNGLAWAYKSSCQLKGEGL